MKKMNAMIDRRRFLKQSVLGAGLTMGWPAFASATTTSRQPESPKFSADPKVIVFQGDSITDSGRNKRQQDPNRSFSLGNGYVNFIAAQLLALHPSDSWLCYNRGISGNKVFQLAERWQEDCLDLKPDILSILIGVNNFWHTLTHGYEGTAETFERDLRALLDRTMQALPDIKIIVGEPFAVAGGTAIDENWYPAFDDYRTAAGNVASDYNTAWIPYQSLFDEALTKAPVEHWCPDGVHPDPAGSYLMAQAWLKAIQTIENQP